MSVTLAEAGAVSYRSGPEWLDKRREAARARLSERGFPTRHDEDWRYTPLTGLLEAKFASPLPVPVPEALDAIAGDLGGGRLVFVNGVYAPDASRPPASWRFSPLAAAAANGREDLLREAHEALWEVEHGFGDLNSALFADGALLELDAEVRTEVPLQLIFVASAPEPVLLNPRNLLVLRRGSEAQVVVTYVSDGASLTNAYTGIVLEEGARLSYAKVQLEGRQATNLESLAVLQGARSTFTASSFALGGRLARHEVAIRLVGEGALAELSGLFVPRGGQLHDNPTLIEHVAARCTSRETYKGVVDEDGTGVFNGRVVVHLDAVGTDASQVNKNLLLSELAEVDTRPRLEILADDVKVSHGAAVGELDEEALFYLRSRGIGEAEARALLITAFAAEMLDRLEPPALKESLEDLVASQLPGSTAREASEPR